MDPYHSLDLLILPVPVLIGPVDLLTGFNSSQILEPKLGPKPTSSGLEPTSFGSEPEPMFEFNPNLFIILNKY